MHLPAIENRSICLRLFFFCSIYTRTKQTLKCSELNFLRFLFSEKEMLVAWILRYLFNYIDKDMSS